MLQTSQLPNNNGEELARGSVLSPCSSSGLQALRRRAVGTTTKKKPLKHLLLFLSAQPAALCLGLHGRLQTKLERLSSEASTAALPQVGTRLPGTSRTPSLEVKGQVASGAAGGNVLSLSRGTENRNHGLCCKGAYRAAAETGIHKHMPCRSRMASQAWLSNSKFRARQ